MRSIDEWRRAIYSRPSTHDPKKERAQVAQALADVLRPSPDRGRAAQESRRCGCGETAVLSGTGRGPATASRPAVQQSNQKRLTRMLARGVAARWCPDRHPTPPPIRFFWQV